MNVGVSAQLYRMKNQVTYAMPRPEVTLDSAMATCAFSLTVNIPPVWMVNIAVFTPARARSCKCRKCKGASSMSN